MHTIPQTWKNWVIQNLMKGVSGDKIASIMLDKGFPFEACRGLLGNNLSQDFSWQWDGRFYQQLSQIELTQRDKGPVREPSDKVQLYRWPGFLSEAECATLVRLTDEKVRPSELASPSADKAFRTSKSADLERRDDPLVEALNQRIADAMGLDSAWGEPIQAQRYQEGEEFKAHTDYFEPGSDEYARHGGRRGQRSWTFMVYLNHNCEGGETEFVRLHTAFRPVSGMALIWNNLMSDGGVNPDTLHHARPILSGSKYVITKWYRDRPYRP
ncbi:2OG-Fe(II) oxygenase [Lacimicrobium sp. SS2-24]|uniref:2OG-Fe(II) oxygenase n=1 Tax=Lacimicrobium sp. SS2-24 TaxID=2005569 RepID=UPI000B4A7CFE|nr:2OG-Fe(II) oxygenase [Lacimicrobium sp. SS2-24]